MKDEYTVTGNYEPLDVKELKELGTNELGKVTGAGKKEQKAAVVFFSMTAGVLYGLALDQACKKWS